MLSTLISVARRSLGMASLNRCIACRHQTLIAACTSIGPARQPQAGPAPASSTPPPHTSAHRRYSGRNFPGCNCRASAVPAMAAADASSGETNSQAASHPSVTSRCCTNMVVR